MNNRIDLAVGVLKQGQPFTAGGLRFEMEGDTSFVVIGWSQWLNFTGLTKVAAIEELSQIKKLCSEMLEGSHDLKKFAADKVIEYRLYFDDGGKASIEICTDKNGTIAWSVDLK